MKKKLTPEKERIARLLSGFSRLPEEVQENIIGYTSGAADVAIRYRIEERKDGT
jgi:hypothetical protein